MSEKIDGILLLYWFPPDGFAPSMMEHIQSFGQYSKYEAYAWNTALGFSALLKKYEFSAVVLHYSLFGGPIYWLDEQWNEYILSMNETLKVAFFQDEYRFWGLRYALLESLGIDLVYTCFEPRWHKDTYYKNGWKGKAIYALTGYVGDALLDRAARLVLSENERHIDIGYRARRLEEYMGRGAMEKHQIAEAFGPKAARCDLKLDISTSEEDRIYGDDWYVFLGNCKGCLGVEAGVSAVDTEDVLWPLWRKMMDERPGFTFEEFSEAVGLERWEGDIYLRTLSPRHLECAALKTCQILFEGQYSGVMEPGVHYILLKKDFSNIDSVLNDFRREECRTEVIRSARKDIIDSGAYHYETFMEGFDAELAELGVKEHGERSGEIARSLETAMQEAAERVAVTGEWFGPQNYPRPNWPENLEHLKSAGFSELVEKLIT